MKIKTILLSSIALSSVTAVAFAGPPLFERVDLNGDGKVTPTEMQIAAADHIKAADTDGDGAATPAEIQVYVEARRAQMHATHFAKQDTNGDGALSKAELSRMPQERFDKLDTDGNGSLSQTELSATKGHEDRGKWNQDPAAQAERKTKRFAKLDKNSDGSITRDEVARMPQELFNKLDANGDGKVSADEFSVANPGRGMHAGTGGRPWVNRGAVRKANPDANGDGKVDVKEAEAMASQHFTQLDTNKDGVVTPEEMRTRGPKGHGHRKGAGKKAMRGGVKSAPQGQ